ncbi:MAG: hypothetical protein ACI9EQ_001094 [Bacteroidia bacterium]
MSTTAKKLEGHKTLNITYSDLTGDNQKQTLNSIQSFLGVKPISLSSGMKKQNTERLQDLIKNYKEIENSLQGTPWERFLK